MINVIIVGGGRVGLHLVDTLKKRHNYSITLVDIHKESEKYIEERYDDVKTVIGDATDKKNLIEAGIEEADILVIATSIDEVNLLIGIIAQDYNLNKVIARTTNPSHIKMFKKLGLNEVVSPELAACSDIEKKIIPQNISEIAVTGKGDYELIDVQVKSSKVIGKCIGDISPSKDFIVVMCKKNDNFLIARDDIVLEKEDIVSILVKTKAIKKTKKFFTKTGILHL